MAKIHLIGTIHYEFNGVRRLEEALKFEKPEILTVEATQQGIDYFAKYRDQDTEMCLKAMKQKGFGKQELSFFEDYLKSNLLNYEIDVCRAYSNQTGIPLYLIDDPSMYRLIRREMLSQFQNLLENINLKNIDKISKELIMKGHDLLYQFIQDLYDGNNSEIIGEQEIIDPYRGILIGKRDETEAKNIIELAQNNDAKIVHVGGCMHNLTDSKNETLYSRLVNFNPSRKTLLAYDK